jgi:hypothetical protein
MSMQAREDDRLARENTLERREGKMRKALHVLLNLPLYEDGHTKYKCAAGDDLSCTCSCGYSVIVEALA